MPNFVTVDTKQNWCVFNGAQSSYYTHVFVGVSFL